MGAPVLDGASTEMAMMTTRMPLVLLEQHLTHQGQMHLVPLKMLLGHPSMGLALLRMHLALQRDQSHCLEVPQRLTLHHLCLEAALALQRGMTRIQVEVSWHLIHLVQVALQRLQEAQVGHTGSSRQ